MPFRFRRRGFRRSNRPPGTTLRWVASSSLLAPITVSAGGPANFDLTPGAPGGEWQSGTTEPTLLRIRGFMIPFVQSGVAASQGGVRESRFAAVIIAWRSAGNAVLDPFVSNDLSSEDVIWYGASCLDTRDFVIPESATPTNPFTSLIAGPGENLIRVDAKARRRVRAETDRLILSVRMGEIQSQGGPPPVAPTFTNVGGRLAWALRFLYRTHR